MTRPDLVPPPIQSEDTGRVGPALRTGTNQGRMPSGTTAEVRNHLRRSAPRHLRQSSPGIDWREQWSNDSGKAGRVLLIDYMSREHTDRRNIVTQEFKDIEGLRGFYRDQEPSQKTSLRVIHVQNASWATRFLLKKFNIDASADLVGTSFGRWAKYERPQRRGGKPVLNARTFPTQRDPWRGISRCAFGMDYLKHYKKDRLGNAAVGLKLLELNRYDSSDNPVHGYDVYVQRISVYIQKSDGTPHSPVDEDIPNLYSEEDGYEQCRHVERQHGPSIDALDQEIPYISKLEMLDNRNTIIIFEHSQSGLVEDTLIGARQEIEQRWRRLSFYLPTDEVTNDDQTTSLYIDLVLRDIFKALGNAWDKLLKLSDSHMAILEDKVYSYGNATDETLAPELWTNAGNWLKVGRLMSLHTEVVTEMQDHLRELLYPYSPRAVQQTFHYDHGVGEAWLGNAPYHFKRRAIRFQESVVKPTEKLSDLLYKNVGIRDAAHSLQLGLSMWLLSWITFIFLPLTFVSGFFGMNVDTFKDDPSIKYWVISAAVLMTVVLMLWYGLKHSLFSQRQGPLRRAEYEKLFHELAESHPNLWSRHGPRDGVIPVGPFSAIKWNLITRWFDPEYTIRTPNHGYDRAEQLGFYSRLKRFFVRQWLGQINVLPRTNRPSDPQGLESGDFHEMGNVGQLSGLATPMSLADADFIAARPLQHQYPRKHL